ncbi:MAG: Clp protease N-terminal domain-containing protein [Hyphomicrobium sp.]
MQTSLALCQAAERHALADGQEQPGSEHFLLAAFDLPDCTARQSFAMIGADPAQLRAAITEQYGQSLAHIGVASAAVDAVLSRPMPIARWPFPPAARASALAVLKQLSKRGGRLPKNAPLSGALVVAAIAEERHSVAARALRAMKIDAARLHDLAVEVARRP